MTCRRIFERLRQCGFDDELDYMTPDLCISFQEHPLVKQPKELTDRSTCHIDVET